MLTPEIAERAIMAERDPEHDGLAHASHARSVDNITDRDVAPGNWILWRSEAKPTAMGTSSSMRSSTPDGHSCWLPCFGSAHDLL